MTNASHEEKQEKTFKNPNIRFSMRFSYVIFPFSIVELAEQLAKAGYASTLGPPPRIPGGQNILLGARGKIARKGDLEIDINDERGVLGAESSSPSLSITGLNEVLQLIKDKLNVDLNKTVAFYETIASVAVETNKNPLEKLGKVAVESKYNKQFREILGEKTSGFTLRLVPQLQIPNQSDWFDITIEPDVVKPTSTYRGLVVYRSKDKSKVEKFMQDMMQILTGIIDIIES